MSGARLPALSRRALVLLILTDSGEQVHSGAWVQSKGGYYLKFSSSYSATSKEFNYRGAHLDLFEEHTGFADGSFLDFNLTAYVEYGLSERSTVVSSTTVQGPACIADRSHRRRCRAIPGGSSYPGSCRSESVWTLRPAPISAGSFCPGRIQGATGVRADTIERWAAAGYWRRGRRASGTGGQELLSAAVLSVIWSWVSPARREVE